MDKREIIKRLNNIAEHVAHTVGEEPFVMSLDDGIAVYEAIELLKKSETNCSEFPNNSDTISRQAAIGEIRKCRFVVDAIEKINGLPSAQPEIVRCKDCQHRDEYGCCKHWKGLSMSAIPIATDDDEFCSYAKRRQDGH